MATEFEIIGITERIGIDDERLFDCFKLRSESGDTLRVDVLVGAELIVENEPTTTAAWLEWAKNQIGKKIKIERIVPYEYFTVGKVVIME